MKNERAILYVQTSDDPERQYSPLVAAQAAVAMELEPALYYLGQALRVITPGAAEQIQQGNLPSLADMFEMTMDLGVPFYVCEASKQMLGWDRVEIRDGFKIVGAATLNDLALDAGATMWF